MMLIKSVDIKNKYNEDNKIKITELTTTLFLGLLNMSCFIWKGYIEKEFYENVPDLAIKLIETNANDE